MATVALTSQDYSDLLRYLAFDRRRVVLNNTQVNKLLFMCYGTYYARTSKRLFEETPKAWPFGPVFPRVYKTFDQKSMPISIKENIPLFSENREAVNICVSVIDKYSHASAYHLSMWSHKEGSPWYQTVYSETPIVWNKEIKDEIIKEYFVKYPVISAS